MIVIINVFIYETIYSLIKIYIYIFYYLNKENILFQKKKKRIWCDKILIEGLNIEFNLILIKNIRIMR